jgi:hypothetical protein
VPLPQSLELLISYSPDGSPARTVTRSCPLGGSVIVSGIAFVHHPAPMPAPVSLHPTP